MVEGTHKGNAGLPMKRLGQLTIVSIPGLSNVTETELKDRVRISGTYLPLWAEAGVRNRMAMSGYCAGFVTPDKPVNPLSEDEITLEMKKDAVPEDAVQVLGSYFWMKLVEIVPVISKDEFEAMSYKLICKAREIDGGVKMDENNLPVPVPQQVITECKAIASERLIKKAGVKVTFYDIILDPANELLLCNTSAGVSLNRLLEKIRYVMAGRFSGDNIGTDNAEEDKRDRETYELTNVVQGGVDPVAVQDVMKENALLEDLKTLSGHQDIWKYIGLPEVKWPKNAGELFNMAVPGIVLTQAFDAELEDVLAEAEDVIKAKGSNYEILEKLYTMYEKVEEEVRSMDGVPVLRSITIEEKGGVAMKYPLGDESHGLLLSSNREVLFGAVMHNSRFDSYTQFETTDNILKSTLTIKAVEGDVIAGPYDVTIKFHGKGQTILRVTPGNTDREIIPMRPGVSLVDIVDRVENSIMICRTMNAMFTTLYRRMAVLYFLASGIKHIVDFGKGGR